MHTKEGKFVIYYPYFKTSTLYLSLLDKFVLHTFTQHCVRAFENILLVIEGLVILDHAIFGSCKICIVQDFDFERTESCKIWIVHDLDCVRIGS